MELHVIERAGSQAVVLLDNEMRIVKPVYDYLKFQRQKDRALNTLKANGSDLRTYWEFLGEYGYEYDKVTPMMSADVYKDYLLGLVFYKYLSDRQLYAVVDLLENRRPQSLDEAQ